MNAQQIIDALPYEVAARLNSDDYFADIPVAVADEGNVKQEIARKMALLTAKTRTKGVGVVVLQVVASDEYAGLQFGPMTLMPSVQVVEQVEINQGPNGTKKSARQVARRIRDVLKGTGFVGLVKDFRAESPCIFPVNLKEDIGDNVRAYQVDFRCIEASTEVPQQVQMPAFVSQAPTNAVALVSATNGAAIYYTTDNSYPWAGNAAATLYAGPVTIPAGGVTIRACAYLSGWVASWVNRATVTAIAG